MMQPKLCLEHHFEFTATLTIAWSIKAWSRLPQGSPHVAIAPSLRTQGDLNAWPPEQELQALSKVLAMSLISVAL